MDKRAWKSITIGEARQWLRGQMRKGGASCPCCKQHVEVRRRALNSGIARWLIWLVRSYEITIAEQSLVRNDEIDPEGIWIEAKRSGARGGDYGKLVHWELARQKDSKDGLQGRGTGLWQPTETGRAFVYGGIVVPAYVELYNGRILKRSEETLSIDEAVGGKLEHELIWQLPASAGVEI